MANRTGQYPQTARIGRSNHADDAQDEEGCEIGIKRGTCQQTTVTQPARHPQWNQQQEQPQSVIVAGDFQPEDECDGSQDGGFEPEKDPRQPCNRLGCSHGHPFVKKREEVYQGGAILEIS